MLKLPILKHIVDNTHPKTRRYPRGISGSLHTPVHHTKSSMRISSWGRGYSGLVISEVTKSPWKVPFAGGGFILCWSYLKFLSPPWEVPFWKGGVILGQSYLKFLSPKWEVPICGDILGWSYPKLLSLHELMKFQIGGGGVVFLYWSYPKFLSPPREFTKSLKGGWGSPTQNTPYSLGFWQNLPPLGQA